MMNNQITNNRTIELVRYTGDWLGYRNGAWVGRYVSRADADRALILRYVDSISPELAR